MRKQTSYIAEWPSQLGMEEAGNTSGETLEYYYTFGFSSHVTVKISLSGRPSQELGTDPALPDVSTRSLWANDQGRA